MNSQRVPVDQVLPRSLMASTMVGFLACAMVGISGCAGPGGLSWSAYGPGPLRAGDTLAATLVRMGQPAQRLQLGAGERLVYARGPMGRHTWLVDIGADGRIQSLVQTLSAERFAAVKPGMTQDELLAWLGPMADVRRLAIEGRYLWFWRFETNECEWFAVTLDRNGRVLDAGNVPDPLCEVKEPR